MPVFEGQGVRLHYEIGGEGPPLILLAGMLSDSASWGPLVAPLEKDFTVIRPDNRTTGRTTCEGPVRVEDMADDAGRLINSLGLGPAHIVGHSLGGVLALLIARDRPQTVRSLALLATSPRPDRRVYALFEGLCRLRKEADPTWLRALYPWLFAPPFFDDARNVEAALVAASAYPHAQSAVAMEAQVAAFSSFDPASLAPVPAIPSLAVFGSDDLIAPPSIASPQLAKLGITQTVTVNNAGHSLHWDASAATLDAFSGLLRP